MKNSILIGYVEKFKPRENDLVGGFATVLVPELSDRQLVISDKRGPRYIQAGISSPEFVQDRLLECNPSPTDEVVVEVSGANGDMRVVAWGYSRFWNKALARIAARPQYRVIATKLSSEGKSLGKKSCEETVFQGSMEEMNAKFACDGLPESTVDRFASLYRSDSFMLRNRFETQKRDGSWVGCRDPRPFPLVGPTYRLMYKEGEVHRELATGTALQINWQYPKCYYGKDSLERFYKMELQGGGYLYWLQERRSLMNAAQKPVADSCGNHLLIHDALICDEQASIRIRILSPEIVWTEVLDPRPELVKLTKPEVAPVSFVAPAPAAVAEADPTTSPKRPVAMPKRSELRKLSQVLFSNSCKFDMR